MLKYYNKEERLQRESIPTEILGLRPEDSIVPNPTSYKEVKQEICNYFKERQFILETLESKEREMFSLYYGLIDGKTQTLEQISKQYYITKERVRQILVRALRKLKYPARINAYMVLTDKELGYDQTKRKINEETCLKLLVPQILETLTILKNKKLSEIKQERYDALSDQEKDADRILQRLLQMSLKEFIQAANITGLDPDKTLGILSENIPLTYISIGSIISIKKSTLIEHDLQTLIDEIEKIGLHFEEESEYIEDFNKKCYASMCEIGLEKVKELCPTTYRGATTALKIKLDDLNFSVRTYNCLKRAGINTVEDLINKSEEDMMKVRNLGRKSLEEVIAKLDSFGFTLKKDDE